MKFVFLAILVMGLAYFGQYSNGILSISTNKYSSAGHNGNAFIPYENNNLGISIDYPVNWHIVEQNSSTIFSPYPYTDNLFGPHVIIQTRNSESNESLDHYMNDFVIASDKKRDYQNFKVINASTNVLLGRLPAYLVYFSYTEPYMDTFSTRKQLEIGTVIIDSNKVYSIYYDADVNDYSTYLPYVKQMIQSFKILSSSTPGNS